MRSRYRGVTPEEMERNIREAVELYLDDLRAQTAIS
jgi:predicted RNase H-like HicB family nuclease